MYAFVNVISYQKNSDVKKDTQQHLKNARKIN